MQKPGCQIESATHPTRIGAAASVNPRVHSETIDQIVNSMITISPLQVVEVSLELKKLTTAEDLVDRHFLSDVTQQATNLPGMLQRINTIHLNRTTIRRQESGQNPQCRGLSSSVGTQESVKTTLGNAQIKIAEGGDRSIGLGQLPQFNHRHRATSGSWT